MALKLNRHVRFGGVSYGPGDEEDLEDALAGSEAELDEEALEARGVIGEPKSAYDRRHGKSKAIAKRKVARKAAVQKGAKKGAKKKAAKAE